MGEVVYFQPRHAVQRPQADDAGAPDERYPAATRAWIWLGAIGTSWLLVLAAAYGTWAAFQSLVP